MQLGGVSIPVAEGACRMSVRKHDEIIPIGPSPVPRPKCDYDLRGSVRPICPECGNSFDVQQVQLRARRTVYVDSDDAVRAVVVLTLVHAMMAAWIVLAVLPYHMQGKAWYDYGLTTSFVRSPYMFPEDVPADPDTYWPFSDPVLSGLAYFLTDSLLWAHLLSFVGLPLCLGTLILMHFVRKRFTRSWRIALWIGLGTSLTAYTYLLFWGGTILSWSID